MKRTNKHADANENKFRSSNTDKEVTERAKEEAMDDIEEDPDLSIHHPNDDLDEGETARLGEDKTDLV